jgi:hypothetical protein
MVGNYGYPFTYGDNLTEEQARKSLKEVLIGTMVIVSLYLVTTQAANAVDKKVLPPGKLLAPTPSADKGIFDRIAATVYSSCANKSSDYWVGVGVGVSIVTVVLMDRYTTKVIPPLSATQIAINYFDAYLGNLRQGLNVTLP